MKNLFKLLVFLIMFPIWALAQVPAVNDTTLYTGTNQLTPQFRYVTSRYGRLNYIWNPLINKYDLLINSKYLRANYAPISPGGYFQIANNLSEGVPATIRTNIGLGQTDMPTFNTVTVLDAGHSTTLTRYGVSFTDYTGSGNSSVITSLLFQQGNTSTGIYTQQTGTGFWLHNSHYGQIGVSGVMGADRVWDFPASESGTTILDADTANMLSTYVHNTRNIIAGLGLTGGGKLNADRTLNADTTVLKSKVGAAIDYSNLSSRIATKLTAANNLSDLTNAATAQTNLGVASVFHTTCITSGTNNAYVEIGKVNDPNTVFGDFNLNGVLMKVIISSDVSGGGTPFNPYTAEYNIILNYWDNAETWNVVNPSQRTGLSSNSAQSAVLQAFLHNPGDGTGYVKLRLLNSINIGWNVTIICYSPFNATFTPLTGTGTDATSYAGQGGITIDNRSGSPQKNVWLNYHAAMFGGSDLYGNTNFQGSTSGSTNVKAAATASGTATLPASGGQLATTANTETFTNKTLGTGTLNPSMIFQAATGGTTDSLGFYNSQKHVSKAVVQGTNMAISQTATTFTVGMSAAIATTLKPASILQTALGTAGTDSLMVKLGATGKAGAIAANYYAPAASPTITGTATFSTSNFTAGLNLKGGFGSSYYNAANTFSSNVSVNTLTGNQTLTIPDATGTIALVSGNLGTPSALVGTNITGTAAALNIGGNAATVTNGVYMVASANLTGQTTFGNILTYTTTATGTFEISSYLNITAISSESVTLQVTYTDENSNVNTTTIPVVSQTSAVFGPTNTAVGNRPALPITIRALTGTVITVLTISGGGGTITFDAGATITQL